MSCLKQVHKIIASLRASLHFSTIKLTPPRAEEPAQSSSGTRRDGAETNNHRQGSKVHKASSKLACAHCQQSPTGVVFLSSDSQVLWRNLSSAPGVPLRQCRDRAQVGDWETSPWASKELLHSQAGWFPRSYSLFAVENGPPFFEGMFQRCESKENHHFQEREG